MDDTRSEQVLPPDSIEPSCGRCDAGWLWSSARGNYTCDCEWGERAAEYESDHEQALQDDAARDYALARLDASVAQVAASLRLTWVRDPEARQVVARTLSEVRHG